MKDQKIADSSAHSSHKGAGMSTTIAGSGNTINHQIHSQPGKFATIVIPILGALISGVGGAYAAHYFTVRSASISAEKQTNGLISIAKEAIDLAKASGSSPQLIARLEEMASQAKATQTSINLFKSDSSGISAQADFWLPEGRAIILGEIASYSVLERYSSGRLKVKLNNDDSTIEAGTQLDYKTSSGTSCRLVYIGESPDQKLFGFRNICE